MKTKLKSLLLISLVLFLFSCFGDDDDDDDDAVVTSSGSFKVNNETYNLIPSPNIMKIEINLSQFDTPLIRSSFSITGIISTSKTASVNFDLYRRPNESLSGTYNILDSFNDNADDGLETYFANANNKRVCSGWTSQAVVFNITNPSLQINANNPEVPNSVTIVDKGNKTYSISFTGNFRQYDEDFIVTEKVPVEINIVGTAQ